MSAPSFNTSINGRPVIQGPGLKKEGIVVLQTFFISLFALIELIFRHGTGSITGFFICLVTFGAIKFGRAGTRYVSVVTPPLALAGVVLGYGILTSGFSPARIGVDFISNIASQAPFLIVMSLYGWFMYFNEKAKSKPSKRKAGAQ